MKLRLFFYLVLGKIRTAFRLDTAKRHTNDQESVYSWIKEWEESEYNPVLFYKLQGKQIFTQI